MPSPNFVTQRNALWAAYEACLMLLLAALAVNVPRVGGIIALSSVLVLTAIRYGYLRQFIVVPSRFQMFLLALFISFSALLLSHTISDENPIAVVTLGVGFTLYFVISNWVVFSPLAIPLLASLLCLSGFMLALDQLTTNYAADYINPNVLGGYIAASMMLLPLAFSRRYKILYFVLAAFYNSCRFTGNFH
ncbi:MAG: hypothetical protein HC842_02435 [Cytophagales bacterium]|nr:hypothetical protein [Cytophagales bacterium]